MPKRPRIDEYELVRDYYAAMLAWLDQRYPGDIAARAEKWRRVEREHRDA